MISAVLIVAVIPADYDIGMSRQYTVSCVECNHYKDDDPHNVAILLWKWVRVKDRKIEQHVIAWFWAPCNPRWRFPRHGPLIARDNKGNIWKIYGTIFETWSREDREQEDFREYPERQWFPKLHMTGARR